MTVPECFQNIIRDIIHERGRKCTKCDDEWIDDYLLPMIKYPDEANGVKMIQRRQKVCDEVRAFLKTLELPRDSYSLFLIRSALFNYQWYM